MPAAKLSFILDDHVWFDDHSHLIVAEGLKVLDVGNGTLKAWVISCPRTSLTFYPGMDRQHAELLLNRLKEASSGELHEWIYQ